MDKTCKINIAQLGRQDTQLVYIFIHQNTSLLVLLEFPETRPTYQEKLYSMKQKISKNSKEKSCKHRIIHQLSHK